MTIVKSITLKKIFLKVHKLIILLNNQLTFSCQEYLVGITSHYHNFMINVLFLLKTNIFFYLYCNNDYFFIKNLLK